MPVWPAAHHATTRNRCWFSMALSLSSYSRVSSNGDIATSLVKFEIHCNGSFHFNGFAVEQEWAITPALNSIDCRGNQNGMSADQHQVLDQALFVDDGAEQDLTLDAGGQGQWRILGVDLLNQAAFGYTLRHANAFGRHGDCEFWNGRSTGRGAENSAQYSADLTTWNSAGHSTGNSRRRS